MTERFPHSAVLDTITLVHAQILADLIYFVLLCPLHDGQVESLPPSGCPPIRQVSPAGYA